MIAPTTRSFSSPVEMRLYEAVMAEGKRTTMPAKMMSEIPLPMPF